jgi:hypothetical protein
MVVLPPPFFIFVQNLRKKKTVQRFKQTVVYDGLTVDDFGMES